MSADASSSSAATEPKSRDYLNNLSLARRANFIEKSTSLEVLFSGADNRI